MILIGACEKPVTPVDPKPKAELSVSDSILNYGTAVETKTIKVTSNSDWTVTVSDPAMLSTDINSGTGNMDLKISVAVNTLPQIRTASVTLTAGTVVKVINVIQAAIDTSGSGDFLASTSQQKRVAMLEDFTGVRCGYCPDGHVRAKAILDANPGKFVVLAVHGGSYAAPAAGWANFTTSFGTALISQAKVSGYPAGTISRKLCSDLGVTPQVAGGYAMSRGSWATAAATVMAMDAPINIGAKATVNAATRELNIRVDMYFTQDQSVANINVALVQDKIYSKQSGGTPDPNNYEQNHVLRHFLTGQWGASLTPTTMATKITKNYTYSIPDLYNGPGPDGGGNVVLENCKIVIFVTRGQVDVLNALEIPITIN